MDKYAELVFFSRLARKGNLSAVAREMGVTPPAASKWLAGLEQRLGVRLVNRTTRRLTLTNEGETFLANTNRILQDIEAMEQDVARSRAAPKGLLRVNATFGFGRKHIAPAVSDFVKRYPEVEVQLYLSDHPVNLADERFDIGIRVGELPDSSLVARKIAANRRLLCASPSYLARTGMPRVPADLSRHNCIFLMQDEEPFGIWRFQRDGEQESVRLRAALSTNDGEAALLWALDGHGVLARSDWDIARHVRSGHLQVILQDYALPPADIVAVYPQRHHLTARVKTFVDFLAARFAERSDRSRNRWTQW